MLGYTVISSSNQLYYQHCRRSVEDGYDLWVSYMILSAEVPEHTCTVPHHAMLLIIITWSKSWTTSLYVGILKAKIITWRKNWFILIQEIKCDQYKDATKWCAISWLIHYTDFSIVFLLMLWVTQLVVVAVLVVVLVIVFVIVLLYWCDCYSTCCACWYCSIETIEHSSNLHSEMIAELV